MRVLIHFSQNSVLKYKWIIDHFFNVISWVAMITEKSMSLTNIFLSLHVVQHAIARIWLKEQSGSKFRILWKCCDIIFSLDALVLIYCPKKLLWFKIFYCHNVGLVFNFCKMNLVLLCTLTSTERKNLWLKCIVLPICPSKQQLILSLIFQKLFCAIVLLGKQKKVSEGLW